MFDFEDIFDCLEKVHSSDVKGKLYRLIYNMNKNVKLKIQTPVGDTDEANTGPIVTQGSVDSAILSSVSIGNDVDEAFSKEYGAENTASEDKNERVVYNSIPLLPLCFMDDCFNMSSTIARAQQGNNIMEEVINRKGLEFNHEKSNFLVVGNTKNRKKIKAEIERSPIKLEGNTMTEVKMMRYLGDQLSINLEESVHQTVLKRLAAAKYAIHEVRTIVEDTRANSPGALNTAFSIWNAGILSMIL